MQIKLRYDFSFIFNVFREPSGHFIPNKNTLLLLFNIFRKSATRAWISWLWRMPFSSACATFTCSSSAHYLRAFLKLGILRQEESSTRLVLSQQFIVSFHPPIHEYVKTHMYIKRFSIPNWDSKKHWQSQNKQPSHPQNTTHSRVINIPQQKNS